jgi:hypothetical protein
MTFFKRQSKIVVIKREANKLSLGEFRSDPNLTGLAARFLRDSDFKLMLDVLRNEHPGWLVLSESVPPEVRAVIQARAEGYTMALANLEAMGVFRESPEQIVATFEAEEEPTPT